MLTAYAVVAIVIISGAICHTIAKHRQADARFWGFMGGCFGPLAIPFVFFAKPITPQQPRQDKDV